MPGSPAPLFMRRAYKRAVYNLAESPLLSASLPPRASGFLRFIPGFSQVSRGFGGAPGAVRGAHPQGTRSGASGFQGVLGARRVFLVHGEKVGNWVWTLRSGFHVKRGLFGKLN